MQDAKEEVRSRLNIEDVIGEYVRLKRAGRSYKGLSPFTQEKTPSFMVSPEKQVWHDFSSNKGGDIFAFIMLVEGLDFKGALELLARKAGVDLGLYSTHSQGLSDKKKRLHRLLLLVADYYQHTLLKNDRALEYVFKTRGLNKQVVQDFKIGFAPDTQDAMTTFLRKKGYSTQDMKDAGLLNSRNSDLFRSRIMIPLMDPVGQIVGFTGRLLGDIKNAPKYLNTPQTLLYDKSRHVYGLSQAKEAIRTSTQAVIVEGNLDVVSSHQVGVNHVVATAGTALTVDQLKILKRLATKIVLALDNDPAGLAATERTIPIAQGVGVDLLIARLPDSVKDPDELIQKDVALWREAINEAIPVIDWIIAEYETRHDLSTAEGKRHFSTAVVAVVGYLNDPVEREHYLQIVAQKLGVSLESLTTKFIQSSEDSSGSPQLKKSVFEATTPEQIEIQQDALLSLAVYDERVRNLLIDIEPASFIGADRQTLLVYLQNNPSHNLLGELPEELQKIETYVKVALLRADDRYARWNHLDRYDETARLVKQVKQETLKKIKRELRDKLRIAENAYDEEKVHTLKTTLNNLIKETKK